MVADGVRDRREPALDAAVQRIVIAALIMRLVRLSRDAVARGREGGVAATAVAPAVRHIGVEAEIVPAFREAVPIGESRLAERAPHRLGLGESEAVALKRLGDRLKNVVHRRIDPIDAASPI